MPRGAVSASATLGMPCADYATRRTCRVRLHAHLEDAGLRVLDCTVYLPNYFDASAAQKLEIVSGRAHWEQGHTPGSAFADLVHDLCGPQDTRVKFPMPSAAQFAAAMSRYGVGEGTRVVLYDDMLNAWAARTG